MSTTVDLTEHTIYVDANIPMYVAGKDHPLRAACQQAFALIARDLA